MAKYRISPDNRKIIERRLPSERYPWGFYMICNSPGDAKNSLKRLLAMDNPAEQLEQGELVDVSGEY